MYNNGGYTMRKYTTYSATKLKKRKGQPWQLIICYIDEEGKRQKKTKVAREAKGKKEAEALAHQWLLEEKAIYEEQEAEEFITIEDVITKHLDDMLKIGKIQRSSHDMELKIMSKNITPYIGDLGFFTADRRDMEKWITALHNKGLKQQTIYIAYTIVNKTYNYYLREGEISRNPCLALRVPKGEPKRSYLTDEQAQKFIQAVNLEYDLRHPMYIALYLAYYTGLRRGEICGLRYRDIDFEKGTISITSAIGVMTGGTYTKPPKNRTSTRTFLLPKQLYEVLNEKRKLENPQPSWFVCGDKENWLSPSTFSNWFARFRKAYDLRDAYDKPLSAHSLRHHLGYSGVRAGVDIASLSKIFGHASRAMTLDRYSDSSPQAVALAVEQIQEYYKKNDLDE